MTKSIGRKSWHCENKLYLLSRGTPKARSMTNLLTTPTVAAVSLTCKLFLNSPFCSVTVNGLPILLNALNSEERKTGRGVVTGEGHLSVSIDQKLSKC